MPNEKINLVGNLHKHIDNGGIDIRVNATVEDDGDDEPIITPEIVFSTSYFGYASIESKLVGFEITPEFLADMGRFFFDASRELELLHMNKGKNR